MDDISIVMDLILNNILITINTFMFKFKSILTVTNLSQPLHHLPMQHTEREDKKDNKVV